MLRSLSKLRTPRYLRSSRIGILGVPFEEGQPRHGVGHGPEAIRATGLVEEMKNIYEGFDVKDYGDITYESLKDIKGVKNMVGLEHVAACMQRVSEKVADIINDERICLTLGGDHSVGLGTIDGHIKATSEDIALLWVDAHADLNTNRTSPTGNIHGMPMALLVKELSDYWPYLPGLDWQKPVMSVRNVAYIGLRSVDSYERLVIDKFGIPAFGMEDVERYGIITVTNMALDKINPNGDRSIHVSFDIDALDKLEAPSTGTSVRGGLTLREGIHIMETVYKTGLLRAMDLVEVNPSIGSSKDVETTVDAAKHIILAALGHSRRGNVPTNETDIPS